MSYETVLSKVEQDNKSNNKKGLLPIVVEKYLKRRLHFEDLSKELSKGSKECLWCQQRIDTLKNILVCLYGTAGSLWNRYGDVRVFEKINSLSSLVGIPFSGSYPEVHYKDGIIVTRENLFPSSDGHYGERIITMDSKGNILETTTIDEDSKETSILNPIDDIYSVYKADGNYIKTWPKKADGSQQFYDSKEQKVFVRDANGNIR